MQATLACTAARCHSNTLPSQDNPGGLGEVLIATAMLWPHVNTATAHGTLGGGGALPPGRALNPRAGLISLSLNSAVATGVYMCDMGTVSKCTENDQWQYYEPGKRLRNLKPRFPKTCCAPPWLATAYLTGKTSLAGTVPQNQTPNPSRLGT